MDNDPAANLPNTAGIDEAVDPAELENQVHNLHAFNNPEAQPQPDTVNPAIPQGPAHNPSPLKRSLYGILTFDGN